MIGVSSYGSAALGNANTLEKTIIRITTVIIYFLNVLMGVSGFSLACSAGTYLGSSPLCFVLWDRVGTVKDFASETFSRSIHNTCENCAFPY